MFEMDATLKRCMIKRMLDKPLMTEVAAHNAFVKQACLNLANEILLCVLSSVSELAIEKMQSDENIDYVYDNVFQNNLDNINNHLLLQCGLMLDGKPANVMLEFVPIENGNNRSVSFTPDKNRDVNLFKIVYRCRIINSIIPLSELKFLIGNKDYLVHELAHLILDRHTNGKSSGVNREEYEKRGAYYYNCPTEFNSYEKQFYENLDNYINNNYDDAKKLLQIRNEKDIMNSLYRIASNTVRPFICFLNTPNKNKFIKDVFEYLQYQLDTREGKKESISYEHIGMTFSDYSYTYGNIKPTESDIYIYLQDISNSLKG